MIEIKREENLTFSSPIITESVPVRLTAGRYNADNSLALFLTDRELGEPIIVCTTCLPNLGLRLQDNQVFIKSWSENEGMLEWLLANNIIEPETRTFTTGFARVHLATLTPETYKEITDGFRTLGH